MSIDPKTNADLWVLPVIGAAGNRKPFVFLNTPFREAYGTFSPDGRWVAYHSNESRRPEISVHGTTVEPGAPAMLFPTRILGGGADIQSGRLDDVTADGRFLVNPVLNEAGAPITLLQNWHPKAKN